MTPEEAYRHSSNHRAEIQNSAACGCFHCLRVFSPSLIESWTDDRDGIGQTAFCPSCGIDSVIGDSGVAFTESLLEEMRARWFGVPKPSAAERVWKAIRSLGMPLAVDVEFQSLEIDDDADLILIELDLHYRQGKDVCCGEPGCYVPFLGLQRGRVAEAARTALTRSRPVTVEITAKLLHEEGFKYRSIGNAIDSTIVYTFTEAANR